MFGWLRNDYCFWSLSNVTSLETSGSFNNLPQLLTQFLEVQAIAV